MKQINEYCIQKMIQVEKFLPSLTTFLKIERKFDVSVEIDDIKFLNLTPADTNYYAYH